MTDRIGQQLANYRLISILGQGGFADVYLGEHIYLNTLAAIKVLQMRLTDEDKQSFLEEARTIAHLKHPSIVRILEYDVVDGIPFLVMEYAPNGTLRQCHPKGTVLPPASIVTYVRQVAAALQYAHDLKLIHRDVKPENMLLSNKNAVLLSDFGLAVIVQSSRDRLQTVAGTVTYMAPEQLQGRASPASDQYALAAVVYEWLSGERLFSGSFIEVATQHVLVPPPSLRDKLPELPTAIDHVIQKALAKNPEQRFASVLEFARAFEQVCQVEEAKQNKSGSGPLGKLFTSYRKHTAAELNVAWPPDGKYIAAGSWDTTIQIRQAESGSRPFTYSGHSSPVHALAWSPIISTSPTKGVLRIASASGAAANADVDNTVQIWNALTGDNPLIYRDHFYFVNAVAWSPDGKKIASASADTNVQVWNAGTGSNALTYRGHSSKVNAVAWSPNGMRIASAGDDRTVQIWDATTGETIFTYHGHTKEVSSVVWSPNSTRIASASYDATVHVWNVG